MNLGLLTEPLSVRLDTGHSSGIVPALEGSSLLDLAVLVSINLIILKETSIQKLA